MMDDLPQVTALDKLKAANSASMNLLPDKSTKKYMAIYNKFISWKNSKNETSFSQNVLMTYFEELSQTFKPSSLWSIYSMLKSTLLMNNDIDLKKYSKLLAFLKKQATGYQGKKSKTLNAEEVEQFLNDAPDEKYLATKVALIIGIIGACRREELCSITIRDVTEHNGSLLLVKLPKTQTHVSRTFTITDKFFHIVKKYMSLRPDDCKCDRFFLNYQNGRCFQQPIGIHKFGNMPKQIAAYLKLPEPECYTGHTFRRTSATLLAEAGADVTSLKRHRSSRSKQVVESDVDDSINCKTRICNQIGQSINLNDESSSAMPSSSTVVNFTEIKSEVFCMSQSSSPSITIDEPQMDLPSKMELPLGNLNLTISNSHVTINFPEKKT